MRQACFRVLELLLKGPAASADVARVGGKSFDARLDELRRWLRERAGYAAYDLTRAPIRCDRKGRVWTYALEPWARSVIVAEKSA